MTSEVSEKEEHIQEEHSQNQNLPQKEDNFQILVKNIPEEVKEEKLREIFEKFGKIIEIKLDQDNGSNQMAYIKFQTKEEKESALNSNEDFEIDGKKLEIKDSSDEENTLFVGNIPYSSTEEDLEKFFTDCGKVKVHIFSINGESKGYAHVTFQDNNAVEMALKKDGEKIMDRPIKIDIIRAKSDLLQNRGRRRGFRGRGRGRGRGGSSFGYFDRERKDEYYKFKRERDRYRERSDRDRHGDRDWENGRPNYRIRDRVRDREFSRRERSRDYYRNRDKERDRGDRERERDRGERERERDRGERERERERDRLDRDRDRVDRERDRVDRERHRVDRERDRVDRERDRVDRERERERDRFDDNRERDRIEKDRERERERGDREIERSDRERERERDMERNRDRDRDRERRHSNYERDYGERE